MTRKTIEGMCCVGGAMRRAWHYSRGAAALAIVSVLLLAPASALAQSEFPFARVEARILELVNDLRHEHGLQSLEREARLDETAAYFAGYIGASGNLDHRADGSTPALRVKQRGYAYCSISENIAYEYDSRGFTPDRLARNFVEGWRDSPTHRANILGGASETGLGIARNAAGEYYAVQLFARPPIAGAKKGAACAPPRRG